VLVSTLAGAAAWLAACDDDPPGNIQCLESISPPSATVAAGGSTTFTVSVANPDDDDATAVVIEWIVSGGGSLSQSETTLTLIDQSDPYGNPLGVNGTSPNTFNALGPDGTYTLQVNVLQGGGCLPQSLPPVAIQVTGTLPVDAGAPDGSTEAGDAASDDAATESGVDAGGDDGADGDDAADGDVTNGDAADAE
jgi:hypothetical protein